MPIFGLSAPTLIFFHTVTWNQTWRWYP